MDGHGDAEVVGIAHLVVRVTDWKRSAEWYQRVLGFERRKSTGFSVFKHPAADFGILLLPTDEALPASSTPTQRLDHLALHVGSMQSLEAWEGRLLREGHPTAIEQQPGIGASLTLHDPDGLEVELFVPAPSSVMDVRAGRVEQVD
jgi:glyoxylase I family protein